MLLYAYYYAGYNMYFKTSQNDSQYTFNLPLSLSLSLVFETCSARALQLRYITNI